MQRRLHHPHFAVGGHEQTRRARVDAHLLDTPVIKVFGVVQAPEKRAHRQEQQAEPASPMGDIETEGPGVQTGTRPND